jgi:hypothetical protein
LKQKQRNAEKNESVNEEKGRDQKSSEIDELAWQSMTLFFFFCFNLNSSDDQKSNLRDLCHLDQRCFKNASLNMDTPLSFLGEGSLSIWPQFSLTDTIILNQ